MDNERKISLFLVQVWFCYPKHPNRMAATGCRAHYIYVLRQMLNVDFLTYELKRK